MFHGVGFLPSNVIFNNHSFENSKYSIYEYFKVDPVNLIRAFAQKFPKKTINFYILTTINRCPVKNPFTCCHLTL